jgi:hypothetical protein
LEFRTFSYRSGFIGLAITGGLAVLAVGLGVLLVTISSVSFQRPLPLLALGLGFALLLNLLALTLVLYWSLAALRLCYRLDRNGLVINWGGTRLIVPMERIQTVSPGGEIDTGVDDIPGFRDLIWTGLRAGRSQLPDGTLARVFTTSSVADSTVVRTPNLAYVISPRDRDAFIEAWRVRRPLGPIQRWQEEEQRVPLLDLYIWRDRVAWVLIGLGLLTNVALHIYLSLVFDRLPTMLSFHFDALGQADRIASRTEILRLPQMASFMLILNLGLGFVLFHRHRIGAYLIWSGGLVLQLLVWGAVLTIVD